MIEKIDSKIIVEVLTIIGWGAGLFIILRSALRHLVGRSKPETPQEQSLATAINGDLLKAMAEMWKEQNDLIHRLETRQAVQESQLREIKAELKRRR